MTSMRDPLVGRALDARYEITNRLARGGMATVYLANDKRLGRPVAVKVMHEGLGDDQDFARKFDREARAAAKLSHPNVVSVFDQGQDHGRPYIVMEYVPGSTLRSVIVRDAPLEVLHALEFMEPILAALAAAHEAGLVHRDVKPENVLISDRGQLKVADFGLAKAITGQSATATQGLLIGTVSYLPPELVTTGRADTRSDVYSAGVVLWEMLTGRKPHVGDTPIQVAYAHVHNDIPLVSEFLPGSERELFPDYLDALIAGATHRDPAYRPADAAQFLAHLRRARVALLEGLTTSPELVAAFTVDDADPTFITNDPDEHTEHTPIIVDDEFYEDDDFDDEAEDAEAEHTPTDFRPYPAAVYRRRRRGLVLVIALVLLALGGSLGGWWFFEGRWTQTPTLAGMTQDEARTAAAGAHIELTFDEAYSETVPVTHIISSDPAAGARVTRGTSIEATVSLGPERFEVPQLVGLPRDDAATALQRVNLTVGTETEVWHEEVPAEVVIEASLEPGTQAKRGDAVDLTVSKGREPIPVAQVTGKAADEARTTLEAAGLKVTVAEEHSRSVPKGNVINQDPGAETTLHRGDTVTITVSKGPVMVTVPNVKSHGVRDATKLLESKGFKVTTKPVSENYLGLGYVSYTDPGIGATAPEGATITLYLV